MIEEGADIIDVGGESTRPGSRSISIDEELDRILPVVRGIRKSTTALLSVDTMKAAVAEAALEAGADIINDVSAFRFDPKMAGVVSGHGAAVILMHMKGTPETMQSDPRYTDIFYEIAGFLRTGLRSPSAGIGRERIIVDPGIGFGKSARGQPGPDRQPRLPRGVGLPVMAGVSRKAFIGKALSVPLTEQARRLHRRRGPVDRPGSPHSQSARRPGYEAGGRYGGRHPFRKVARTRRAIREGRCRR